MQDELLLDRLDQVRALADPLRLRMVEALVASERSVAELARAVRAPITRLYHHMDLLLDAGLIEITRRVPRRGAEERFYRAKARHYRLDGSLLDLAPDPTRSTESFVELARSTLGGALNQLVDGLRSGRVVPARRGHGLLLETRNLRLSAAGFAALATELPRWLDDFTRRYGTTRGREFHVTLAGFPADVPKRRSGR